MWLPIAWAFARKNWRAVAVGLVLAVFALMVVKIKALNNERDRLTVEKNNVLAKLDTVRVVYHDGVRAVSERLAESAKEIASLRDSLKLPGKTKVVTRVVVQAAPTTATHDSVPIAQVADTFVARDSLTGPPTDVRVAVTVIKPPNGPLLSRWDWDVRPHALPLAVDVGCLDRYKPNVLVNTPPWASVSNVVTTVSTEVCGRARDQAGGHKLGWYLLRGAAILGVYTAGRAHLP